MIWITRTGAPWRDLPGEFGNWNTVHRRFRRWVKSGVFQRIFDVIEKDLDLKAVMVDGTFAKVHQHGAGAKSGCPPDESADRQAIGRSRGGLTTKLMAKVDKTGRLVKFTIRPGNAAEAPEVPTILDGVLTGKLIADEAYDSDPIRLAFAAGGIVATIPPGSIAGSSIGTTRYGVGPATLSRTNSATSSSFGAVATRYNKLADSYCAMVNLASWIIETRSTRRTAEEPVYKPSDKFPAYNTQLPLALALVA